MPEFLSTSICRGFILAAAVAGSASAEGGVCTLGPPRVLPETANEFGAIEPEPMPGELPAWVLHLPGVPLLFAGLDPPPLLRNLTESGIAKLLHDTRWMRRAHIGTADLVAVYEHLVDGGIVPATAKRRGDVKTLGIPLYIDNFVSDSLLRRLLRSTQPAFRGVRRQPMAVLAKPGEGVRMHVIPEPRWIHQVHGKSIWRLASPEALKAAGEAADVEGCADSGPEVDITCELQPGQALFVPGHWGWRSCASAGEEAFTLAVGAGGRSQAWPDHMHDIASGDIAAVRRHFEANDTFVHVGDPVAGTTPLEYAVAMGDVKMAKLAEKFGGRISDTGSPTMLYPVHHATTFRQVEALEWLLQKRANPNAKTKAGIGAIHQASMSGDLQILSLLIQSRASVHEGVSEHKYAPVHFATREGHIGVLKKLRDAGAELSALDAKGCEATAFCAMTGDIPTLQFLLAEEGLSPDAHCDKGQTAAHLAARTNTTAVLSLLKKQKANLKLKDDSRYTPLHTAVVNGATKVIEWFATAGVKGLSPKTSGLLHVAAWYNVESSIQSLLSHGANVNDLDPKSKMVPLELASSPEVFDLLEKMGAKRPEGFEHRSASRGMLRVLKKLVTEPVAAARLREPFEGLYMAHFAAHGGNRDVLDWLCGQMGAECCNSSSWDKTWKRHPLHFAVWARDEAKGDERRQLAGLEVTKYLVKDQHCPVDIPDSMGVAPLELAGVTGNLKIVQFLIKEGGADIGGLWRAKREGALDKQVEKWAMKHAPKGAYAKWLKLDLPKPGPAPAPAPKAPPENGSDDSEKVEL